MIRTFTKLPAILGLASLGLFVLPPFARAADAPANPGPTANQVRPLALPAGFEAKSGEMDNGIKTGLAKITERAVTKGDFNKFLAELSKPDKDRAREFKNVDQAKLDAAIDKIQAEWKAKYGKDFDVEKKIVFDEHFQTVEGKVTDPAVALNDWPVAPTDMSSAVTAGAVQPGANNKEVKKEAKQEKLEKGRNVAIVRMPAGWGFPTMTVSMVHHLPAFWRIDIPNDRTGEQIYNDLLAQLTWIGDHSANWPADVNDGYRMMAYHAISALYGVPPMAAKG